LSSIRTKKVRHPPSPSSSSRGISRLIVRHTQEDDPDYALENKYGKHMVANPLNELLDY
jgi:hypothetical protein